LFRTIIDRGTKLYNLQRHRSLFNPYSEDRMSMLRTTLFVLAALLLAPLSAQATDTSLMTRLTISGEPGEFVSGGQTAVYTPADGAFQLQHDANTSQGIMLYFYTPGLSHYWYVWIGGPDGTSPQLGEYTGATRFAPGTPGTPRLSVYGDHRGCNELTGSFNVKRIVYNSDGAVLSLWVTFTQYCDNSTKALTGELIFQVDSDTPATPTSWGQLKMLYR